MRYKPISVFVVVILIQVLIFKAVCNDRAVSNTYVPLFKLKRLASLTAYRCQSEDQMERFNCYLRELYEMLPDFETFLTISQLNETVYTEGRISWGFSPMAERSFIGIVAEELSSSSSLKAIYDSTFYPLMNTLKHDVRRIRYPISDGYLLPLERACRTLPPINVPTISAKDVCPTLSECVRSVHSSTAHACKEDNGCDVEKAIPLMIDLFFFKVSFAFVDKFCSGRCTGDSRCNMEEEFTSIVKQVDLIKAFVIMAPEKPYGEFYRDGQTRRAYSQIGPAMQIISENDDKFSVAHFTCKEIEAQPACRVMTFYPHYLLLKQMKEERLHPGDTRDLTPYENVDHAKIIQLKKQALKHIAVLSAIKTLDSNLKAEARGFASYLKGIASFDQAIANADVEFINGKLTTFDSTFRTLSGKVNTDVSNAMTAMTAILTAQLVEQTIALVAKIIAEANPIKAIFSGVDTAGVREQAVAVAEAAAQLAHGIALFVNLDGLATDTSDIATDLHNNQKQIDSLVILVNKIKNNQADEIDDDAETFIDQYARYTPTVDRSRLAQNTAKWGAFKESTCNLLNGVEGIGASAGEAVANGFLLCENLEGTIAEFDALRENMFDFQFELVDSLARVVRGNVAKKLANSIQDQEHQEDQGDHMFRADQLLGGFLMAQTFLQTQAWLYCDKLEYKNEGQRVQPCSPQTGLFTDNELDNLVAFTDHQTYISIERTVHIPSKPRFIGDLGFINIHTFARERTASFRLPQKLTWLYHFDWSLIGEFHAPYVENFQLFLPRKYEPGSVNVKTSTRIVVSADMEAGSYISADRESSVLYKLPEKQTSYVTVYQDGYRTSTCFKEIHNPYSLCNNLPKICHTSTSVAGDSLLPTTLSRWRVTYSVQSAGQEVEWLAPNSMTDLKLIAKVTLRMPPRNLPGSQRSSIESPTDQPDVCCEGNTYRSSLVSSDCEDCPSGSTSKLGGYYCEADTTTLKKKQHVFLHEDSSKRRHSAVSRVSSRSHKVNDKRRHSAVSHVSSRSHKVNDNLKVL